MNIYIQKKLYESGFLIGADLEQGTILQVILGLQKELHR